MQSKEEFLSGISDIRKGERVRVLFDLLMYELTGGKGPDDQLSKSHFFELMKEALTKEHEALIKVMPQVQLGGSKQPRRKSKKQTPGESVSDSD